MVRRSWAAPSLRAISSEYATSSAFATGPELGYSGGGELLADENPRPPPPFGLSRVVKEDLGEGG